MYDLIQSALPPPAKRLHTRTQAMEAARSALATASCNANTVSLLKNLLRAEGSEGNVGTESSKYARPKPPRSANTGTRGLKNIQVHGEDTINISPHEKLVLATETVNYALKALSDAIKQQGKATAARDTTIAAAKSSTQAKPSGRPLKSRSPNSPSKREHLQSTSTCTQKDSIQSANVTAVAECARLSFSYLRAQKERRDSKDLQLENGILAFVGKCITLGLDSIAIRELRALKRCLDETKPMSGCKPRKQRADIASTATGVDQFSVLDLLDFHRDAKQDDALLSVVTTHQCHAIKVITSRKRPAELSELSDLLNSNSSSTPLRFAYQLASQHGFTELVIRQLESVCGALLRA
jgi:separase